MEIKYLGHSAFEIKTNEYKILIDPFLVMSPSYDISDISTIFVTHAHSDHLGNAIKISQKTGAEIVAVFELANYCGLQGAKTRGINLGGWLKFEWGRVIAVPAFHSSSLADGTYGGCPCGYIFEIEGKHIYHAGDTSLNSEMKMLGEVYNLDIAMLPVGGEYTMDIEHAVKASEWLQANIVIPMHYNTFSAIEIDISDFDKSIKNIGKNPLILGINQSIEI